MFTAHNVSTVNIVDVNVDEHTCFLAVEERVTIRELLDTTDFLNAAYILSAIEKFDQLNL